MPINKGQSARLVIAFAWAIHALSWFLPAETDWLFQTTFRGWSAFGAALALSFPPPSPDSPGDPWYYLVLAGASAATTFMFVVGSPLAVWRGSRSVRRACAWATITAFIVNSHWYVFWHWAIREDLRIGYFLWWLSFGLLAIGLFLLSSNSTAKQYMHVTQTEAQEST